MKKQEAIDFVTQELSKNRKKSDIIYALCEKTGANWAEVQKFVYQVEFEQRKKIAKKQSPLIFIFSAGFILGGFALGIYTLYATANGINISYHSIPYAGNVAGAVTGLGLIAGGVIGLWEKIKVILE